MRWGRRRRVFALSFSERCRPPGADTNSQLKVSAPVSGGGSLRDRQTRRRIELLNLDRSIEIDGLERARLLGGSQLARVMRHWGVGVSSAPQAHATRSGCQPGLRRNANTQTK